MPVTAVLFWWMAAMHVVWGVQDVRKRYDARAATQNARMSCEAEGGFYGSVTGGAAAPTNEETKAPTHSDCCLKWSMETARVDR